MKRNFLFLRGLLLFLLMASTACKEKRSGVVTATFDNGFPQKIMYYSVNKGDSVLVKSVEYHPNRQIFIEGHYKNGQRDGEWKSWYEDGKLWSKGYFKNGIQVEKVESYYENGQLRYMGQYDNNGKSKGIWKIYDENGKQIEEVNYDKPDNAPKGANPLFSPN